MNYCYACSIASCLVLHIAKGGGERNLLLKYKLRVESQVQQLKEYNKCELFIC
jgi:hypothetical protein